MSVRGECGRGGLKSVEEGAHWKEGVCEWGGLTSVMSDPWEGGEECGWTWGGLYCVRKEEEGEEEDAGESCSSDQNHASALGSL